MQLDRIFFADKEIKTLATYLANFALVLSQSTRRRGYGESQSSA
jgi:hypothetical protein